MAYEKTQTATIRGKANLNFIDEFAYILGTIMKIETHLCLSSIHESCPALSASDIKNGLTCRIRCDMDGSYSLSSLSPILPRHRLGSLVSQHQPEGGRAPFLPGPPRHSRGAARMARSTAASGPAARGAHSMCYTGQAISTTRFLPPFFARYRAASASLIKSFTVAIPPAG